MNKYLIINEADNVAVALEDLPAGTEAGQLILKETIPSGHKFALKDINPGEKVLKYGNPIGFATEFIPSGCHVHTHNMKTGLSGELEYSYRPDQAPPFDAASAQLADEFPDTFMGYVRANGKVGIRNEIWIIPTVGCVNSAAERIAALAKEKFGHIEAIDDFIAFPHPYGCSQLGDDQENTRKILADLAMHPNAGGVLLLGLGCENSGVEEVKTYIQGFGQLPIECLITQDCTDEIGEALSLISQLVIKAGKCQRVPVSMDKLIVGVKCGGSDGLSGITANPLVGRFADMLISKGGSVIMTEVPEMFGAETILMDRCKDEETFTSTVKMINDFKDYFISHNQPVYENPSPGNKAGGITTLEDKSLGCTQKSGTSKVNDVLSYGEQVKRSGLSLLYSPGNDLVASTALAASGAQLVLFTTGRGTPFASPVPTMKISSNSKLAAKKPGWIDFDAGTIVSCGESFDSAASKLYSSVTAIASGSYVKSEIAGYHDMAIFKQSITL